MLRRAPLRVLVPLALMAWLGACTQQNTADQQAQQAAAAVNDIALGIDRLLLFPNPIGTDPFAQNGGTFETDTTDYAAAYYAAIDPANAEDTIDKWRAANGFTGFASPARPGTEHLAVFRDVRDLGYGRRMTARRNSDDGSIAFYVENYNVAPGGSTSYSSDFNVDAAIRRDTQWHVGTNAIEWTTTPCIPGYDPPDCNGTVKFAKYYNFSSADGTRQLSVDLDGHGKKAMPGPCITCHGGRGDPLTPPDAISGKPRFPLVENSLSRKRGDVEAHLHGQNVDSFSFSTDIAGFAKSDMQPLLKDFNQWILCTYPTPAAASVTGTWGTCNRPIAGANEWQGTAGPMIEAWYGGPGMPAAIFNDAYQPAGWTTNTQIPGTTLTDTQLYQTVVVPYCRTCHILRGTANQSDLNFDTLGTPAVGAIPATGFRSYADRIKAHVFDRGNMPLAQIPHSDFWNSTAPPMLASFIDSQLGAGTATANGMPLMPGRPIADPGPNRMVRTNANAVLTGENSLFASSFAWSEPTPSGHVNISNANGMVAIFNADAAGSYVVRLTVNNGANFKDVTITVDDNFPDPLNIKFAQVKNVLENVLHKGTTTCVSCHTKNVVVPAPQNTPPIWYSSTLSGGGDRDGDGLVNATDDAWFLKALSGRVNLTEIEASALLRKPSGNHHRGGKLIDVTDTTPGGGLSNYSILYNWILAGMQPGGVAASPIVNGGLSPATLTFSGAPAFATGVTLDGSASIGATSFFWSVTGPTGSTGAQAFVTSPTSATTTLNVPAAGTYTVSLFVSDGISSDTVQRTITVNETPVVADFTPGSVGPPVNQSVSFSGTPLAGSITLTSSSSGSPASCQWQATGPGGATLDGVAVPTANPPATVTKSCGSPALLNVPASSIGGTYVVTLTAISSLGTASAPVTHSLTITSAGSGVVANAGASGTVTVTFTNPASSTPGGGVAAPDQNGIPGAAVALNGSASTGPGTLTYSWSITAQPGNATGAYVPTITSPTSASTTLNVHRAGVYTVSLFVSNGLPPGPSNTATRTITVNANAITFTTMKSRFVSLGCTGCHSSGSVTPPSWVDETVGGLTLYQRVTARVNATDPAQSFIVRCPSQGDCGMGQQTGFTNSNLTNYDEFLNWIMSGAPNN
jgi:hypothetical protein